MANLQREAKCLPSAVYIVLILMYLRMSRKLKSSPATKVATAMPPASFHLFMSPSRLEVARGQPVCGGAREIFP
jgi:hypothetical protein